MVTSDEKELSKKDVPWWFSCRVALSFVGFLGFANLYALRVNMSVAMVCMVNQTWLKEVTVTEVTNGNSSYHGCGGESVAENTTTIDVDGEFQWDKDKQGLILGAFFWGYTVTQVPGGWLSARFGGKHVFGWSMLAAAIATLLMPIGARVHYIFLIVLRVITGLGEGVVWPAMNSMWAYWVPPMERSKLASFTYAGSQFGNVITLPIAAILCEYGFDDGWGSIFYVLGGLGVVWFVLWMVVTADTPEKHPRITEAEKHYIQRSLQGQVNTTQDTKLVVPWLSILKSGPVWGLIITHMMANFGTYAFLTNIPTYLKEVLHFDIKKNGFISAIPYIGMWVMVNLSGLLADTLRSRGILSTTWTRKIFNTVGQLVPAVMCICLGYVDCTHPVIAIVLLTICVTFIGCLYGAGFVINFVDIAPKYASIIFGISNTTATLPGFIAPLVIAALTRNQSQQEWRNVFYVLACVYAVGIVSFLALGSGDLQSWAREPVSDELCVKVNGKEEQTEENEENKKLTSDV